MAEIHKLLFFPMDMTYWSSILNSYTTVKDIKDKDIQLYACASAYISISLSEDSSESPEFTDLVYVSAGAFTKEGLIDAISQIYVTLAGKLIIPTTAYFLRLLVQDKAELNMCLAIASLIYLESDVHKYLPYELAQGVIAITNGTINSNISRVIQHIMYRLIHTAIDQRGIRAIEKFYSINFKKKFPYSVKNYTNTDLLPSIGKVSPTNIKKFDIEDFNIQRILGAGSSGTVYKGLISGKSVALKKQSIASFDSSILEIAIARTLKHPNIESVKGFTFDNGSVYFTMPVRLMSLAEAIHMGRSYEEEFNAVNSILLNGEVGLLPLIKYDIRRRIAIHIIRGLLYLHSNGIIHGDVKPGNILLTKSYKAKLADFGSSSIYVIPGIENQPDRNHPGTFEYRSIEQMVSSYPLYSYEVDVWAAGITLLEMETGCYYINREYFADTLEIKGVDQAYFEVRRRIRQVLGQDGTRDLECIEDQYFKNILITMYAFDPKRRHITSQILENFEQNVR
jgi:serine/threonine protein kinase